MAMQLSWEPDMVSSVLLRSSLSWVPNMDSNEYTISTWQHESMKKTVISKEHAIAHFVTY